MRYSKILLIILVAFILLVSTVIASPPEDDCYDFCDYDYDACEDNCIANDDTDECYELCDYNDDYCYYSCENDECYDYCDDDYYACTDDSFYCEYYYLYCEYECGTDECYNECDICYDYCDDDCDECETCENDCENAECNGECNLCYDECESDYEDCEDEYCEEEFNECYDDCDDCYDDCSDYCCENCDDNECENNCMASACDNHDEGWNPPSRPKWRDPEPVDQTMEEDTTLNFQVYAKSSPNCLEVYYSINDPSFIIENIDNVAWISWTPPENWYGIKDIIITASDGSESITAEISITVTDVPEDEDGDGEYDGINDNVVYNPEKVDTNIESLALVINGSDDTSQIFEGVQTVEIKEAEEPIVSFDYDFDATESLNLVNLSITKQEENATQGSIIIKGITLVNTTKTAYINDISESDYLCIKDAEIASITEISEDCDGEDETLILCSAEGTTENGYTCTDIGDKYKVDGLQHSGAKETEFCGDNICQSEESCSLCSMDCGACPTTSTGYGASSSKKITIIESEPVECERVSRECNDWNQCIKAGIQSRSCEIIEECGDRTKTKTEWEEQSCVYKEPEIEELNEEQQPQNQKSTIKNFFTTTGAVIKDKTGFEIKTQIGLGGVMIIFLLTLFVVKMKKYPIQKKRKSSKK